MPVSVTIDKAIEEITLLPANIMEHDLSSLDGTIIETNKRLATLNLRLEAWVNSGIGRTMVGYAQIHDNESPTETMWALAYDIENLGRSIESLLTAPRAIKMAALKRLPDLLRAWPERAEPASKSVGSSAFIVSLFRPPRSPIEHANARSVEEHLESGLAVPLLGMENQ
jgi:hypothetical protein